MSRRAALALMMRPIYGSQSAERFATSSAFFPTQWEQGLHRRGYSLGYRDLPSQFAIGSMLSGLGYARTCSMHHHQSFMFTHTSSGREEDTSPNAKQWEQLHEEQNRRELKSLNVGECDGRGHIASSSQLHCLSSLA